MGKCGLEESVLTSPGFLGRLLTSLVGRVLLGFTCCLEALLSFTGSPGSHQSGHLLKLHFPLCSGSNLKLPVASWALELTDLGKRPSVCHAGPQHTRFSRCLSRMTSTVGCFCRMQTLMAAPRCPGTAGRHSSEGWQRGIWMPLWLRPDFSDPDDQNDSTMEVEEVNEVSVRAKSPGATELLMQVFKPLPTP